MDLIWNFCILSAVTWNDRVSNGAPEFFEGPLHKTDYDKFEPVSVMASLLSKLIRELEITLTMSAFIFAALWRLLFFS